MFLVQFANQPFQLRPIPSDAADSEKIRIIIEWMCEESILPTVAVDPELLDERTCPCCGKDLIVLDRQLVDAVNGYLENNSSIDHLINVLNEQVNLLGYIAIVQEHYNSLVVNQ